MPALSLALCSSLLCVCMCVCVSFAKALFVINDIIKQSQGLRKNFAATVGLRFGVVGLALGCLALTHLRHFRTGTGGHRRSLAWLIATVIVLFGTAQVGAGVIEGNTTDPTYRSGAAQRRQPGQVEPRLYLC